MKKITKEEFCKWVKENKWVIIGVLSLAGGIVCGNILYKQGIYACLNTVLGMEIRDHDYATQLLWEAYEELSPKKQKEIIEIGKRAYEFIEKKGYNYFHA